MDEERGGQERDRLHVPGGYPEPGREGPATVREYADPLVYERMKEVKDRNEDERKPDEEEVVVIDDPAGFPDKKEDSDRDSNGGEFDGRVIKGKIIPTSKS